jgi:hypothetical protein
VDYWSATMERHHARYGHRWGVKGEFFLGGFEVNKGCDDGMSFNKELQKFNIPYSLFKRLRKKSMCFQIWKGRKIPKQHLKEKHHKNHTKGTRNFFFGKCTWISPTRCTRKKTLMK